MWPTQSGSSLGQTEAAVCAHVMWEVAGREESKTDWREGISECIHVYAGMGVMWKILSTYKH